MSIATIEAQPRVTVVEFTKDKISVTIEDGRVVFVPLSWYPRLLHATEVEQNHWRILEDTDDRDIVYWEQLDEMVPVVALFAGVPSRESKRSFDRWLAQRGSST